MQSERGYDATATTNAVRFQVGTLLRLARGAASRDPDRQPLFIAHGTWFHAFLRVNDLAATDAPVFARLAYEHRQDMLVDYRRDRVIDSCAAGCAPVAAMNVIYWWPIAPGLAKSFSFEDLYSVPQLKVTNTRVIKYRLLQFGDMVVCDRISGLQGRPLSGLLGLMFRIIGEGRVVESRIALTGDGLQLVRAHSKKGLAGLWTTVTVYPNGRAIKGLPSGRPDLDAILERLKRSLDIEYKPLVLER